MHHKSLLLPIEIHFCSRTPGYGADGREQVCSSVTSQLGEDSRQTRSTVSSHIHEKASFHQPAAWGKDGATSLRHGNGAVQSSATPRDWSASPCSSQGSTTLPGRSNATANDNRASPSLPEVASSSRPERAELQDAVGGNIALPDRPSKGQIAPSKSGRALDRRDTSAGRPPRCPFCSLLHSAVNQLA